MKKRGESCKPSVFAFQNELLEDVQWDEFSVILYSQSILVFCYIFFLALDFLEHVKIQFCWSLESLISGQNGVKVNDIKVLNFNSLIFQWLVASMYLETFFEEVEAILIKSVLMLPVLPSFAFVAGPSDKCEVFRVNCVTYFEQIISKMIVCRTVIYHNSLDTCPTNTSYCKISS